MATWIEALLIGGAIAFLLWLAERAEAERREFDTERRAHDDEVW